MMDDFCLRTLDFGTDATVIGPNRKDVEEVRKSWNAGAVSGGSDCGPLLLPLFPVLGMYIAVKRKTCRKDAQIPNNKMI